MPLSARQGFLGAGAVFDWDTIRGQQVDYYLQYKGDASGQIKIFDNEQPPDQLQQTEYYAVASILLADTQQTDSPYGYEQGDTKLSSNGGTVCWIPYDGANFLFGRATVGAPNLSLTASGSNASAKMVTASLGPKDGKVYAFPYDDNVIRIYDPATDTVTTQDYGIDMSGAGTYAVSQATPSGKIYAFGGTADHVLILDTVANTAVTSNFSGVYDTSTTSAKYTTAVLSPYDDKIYSPQHLSANVGWLVIDTVSNTAEIQTWSGVANVTHEAACLGFDGNIWASPGGTDNTWTTIEPSSNTVSKVTQTGVFTGSDTEGCVSHPNGNIYVNAVNRIYEFNPVDSTTTSLRNLSGQTYAAPTVFSRIGWGAPSTQANVNIYFTPGQLGQGGTGGVTLSSDGELTESKHYYNWSAMAISPYFNKK